MGVFWVKHTNTTTRQLSETVTDPHLFVSPIFSSKGSCMYFKQQHEIFILDRQWSLIPG